MSVEIGVGTGRFAFPLGIRSGLEPLAKMATIARDRGISVVEGPTARGSPAFHLSPRARVFLARSSSSTTWSVPFGPWSLRAVSRAICPTGPRPPHPNGVRQVT